MSRRKNGPIIIVGRQGCQATKMTMFMFRLLMGYLKADRRKK